MSLYNRILVPVDGDAPASHALDHALAIARDQGARLKLI
ncbi:MAG TPA: universal stress protein, partial [Chromatiales bacterium]|nr:universal stress protein [Chromatiales bacterium]